MNGRSAILASVAIYPLVGSAGSFEIIINNVTVINN